MGSCRSLRTCVTALAVAVLVLGWVAVLPTASAGDGYLVYGHASNTFTVSPTGGDDTANLQAAFDACGAKGPGCTVQLTSGTFHTAQIVVHEFKGVFRGMGERRTTVEALPDLPVSTDYPAWLLHPPSATNPWPNLFTFFNGSYSISDMTFVEPHGTPTQGYWINAALTTHALFAFISITGVSANAAVDHITMIGGPGDWTSGGPFLFNVINGIFPQALLLAPGATDFHEVMPFQVTFGATNSAFYTIDNPLAFEQLVGSQITIAGNVFDTTEYPVALVDLSHTVTVVSRNLARNVFYMAGVLALQGIPISPLLPCEMPSRLFVTENEFQFTNIANAVAAQDIGGFFGCERSLDVVVAGNTLYGDETSFPAIVGISMRSMVVIENDIIGVGSAGVWLQDGPGVVARNEIRGNGIGILLVAAADVTVKGNEIKDCAWWGIGLIEGSRDNLVVENEIEGTGATPASPGMPPPPGPTPFDLYWDRTGDGNVWKGNECETSDPPGLCAVH